MIDIFVEPHSQIPAHEQIKDQIKFACVRQELKPGYALASIRQLAGQLGLGDGVVRRAYRELCAVGLLVTEGRKHVVGMPAGTAASRNDVVQASAEHCDELIAWAREEKLSAVALSRFALRRAVVREMASPSYLFVDACTLAADASAACVSKAWKIRVVGVSLDNFSTLWSNKAQDISAVLVNEHLYEDVMAVAGEIAPRVFSVRAHLDERLRRRISRLPPRSTVLLVCRAEDFVRAGRALVRNCEHTFGRRWRFQAKKLSEIADLTDFIRTQPQRLFLFCPPAWETLPTRVKRMARVVPALTKPDPQSLEEIRIAAGVLL